MSDELYGLTEADVRWLRELKRAHTNGELGTRPRHQRKPLRWIPPNRLIKFELAANLALGGQAAAYVLRWNEDTELYETTDTEIIVKDFTDTPGSWIGATGFQGWATLPDANDDGTYEIVWMETFARFVECQLIGNISGGSATATILNDGWYDIKEPTADPITVHDPLGLFKAARANALCKAWYNPRTDSYVAVECQSLAGWLDVTLLSDMSGTPKSASAQVNGYRGTQQDIQTPGSTISVTGIAGISDGLVTGDRAIAFYSSEDDEYFVISAANVGQQFISFELTGAGSGEVIDTFGGTSVTGQTVDILDPIPLFGAALDETETYSGVGAKGYAVKVGDGEYLALNMEQETTRYLVTIEDDDTDASPFECTITGVYGRVPNNQRTVATTLEATNPLGWTWDVGAKAIVGLFDGAWIIETAECEA